MDLGEIYMDLGEKVIFGVENDEKSIKMMRIEKNDENWEKWWKIEKNDENWEKMIYIALAEGNM